MIQTIDPSPGQLEAIDFALSTYGERTIKGLAGTGKTSTMFALFNALIKDGRSPQIIAPTNKACFVLRRKGVPNAKTVHALSQQLVGVKKDKDGNEEPIFEDKPFEADCLLVDEASMVNTDLAYNLRDFCSDIIWVGDHGQLPPVGENESVAFKCPQQFELTEIFRQAEGSPIIDYAYAMRQGEGYGYRVPTSTNGEGVFYHPKASAIEAAKFHNKIDLYLASTNKTRVGVNIAVRKAKGYESYTIAPGEKLILLDTKRRLGLSNGEIVTVEEYHARHEDFHLVNVSTCLGKSFNLAIPYHGLNREKPLPQDEMPELPGHLRNRYYVCRADYGYCITIHKSQGSEAENVAIIAPGWMPKGSEPRMRYTAATRAAKNLLILGA